MAKGEKFNPYHKWLGISPDEQPFDFYRLLGVHRFESDADVIDNAADGRMTSLRNRKTGPNAKFAEKLMNEVTKAKLCLLDPQKKSAYDAKLRAVVAKAEQAAVDPLAPPPGGWQEASYQQPAYGAPAPTSQAKQKPGISVPLPWIIGGGALVVALLLLGVGVLVYLGSSSSGDSGDSVASGSGSSGEKPGGSSTGEARKLLLNIPPRLRGVVTVEVDGKKQVVPENGPVEISIEPGRSSLSIARPGYNPYSATFDGRAGGAITVDPEWKPRGLLVIHWKESDRQGAVIKINGEVIDYETTAHELTPTTISLATETGVREVHIERKGEIFRQNVDVNGLTPAVITPDLIRTEGWERMDLLSKLDPEKHVWAGGFAPGHEKLTLRNAFGTQVLLPYKIPEEEFELRLSLATPRDAQPSVVFTMPYANSSLQFVAGIKSASIRTTDGEKHLPGTRYRAGFMWTNAVQEVVFSVKNGAAGIRFNGRNLVNWRVQVDQLDPYYHYDAEREHAASLSVLGGGVSLESITLSAPVSLQPAPDCDASALLVHAGHAYRRLPEPRQWFDAVRMCEAMGGRLCCVETPEEFEFIKKAYVPWRGVWLGGTDVHQAGNVQYLTGETPPRFLWNEGQPENRPIRAYFLALEGETKLCSSWGPEILPAICEWETTDPPAPPEQVTSTELAQFMLEPTRDSASEPYTFGGHTYCHFAKEVSWDQAMVFCRKLGGHLCIVETEEENLAIQAHPEKETAWLGGLADREADEWVWMDGQPLRYKGWLDLRNRTQLGGRIRGSMNGPKYQWFSGDTGQRFFFLCEWDQLDPPLLKKWLAGETIPDPPPVPFRGELPKISRAN